MDILIEGFLKPYLLFFLGLKMFSQAQTKQNLGQYFCEVYCEKLAVILKSDN